MTFQSSLSGLNSSMVAIDAIGNNLANSSTNGYKASQAHFSSVFAAAVAGAAPAHFSGLGSGVTSVVRSFAQGEVTMTGNSLDVAISGQGLFRLENEGTITYTRNGKFHLFDEKATQRTLLANEYGQHVTGYPVSATGQIDKSAPAEITVDRRMDASATTSVALNVNLGAGAEIPADDNGGPLPFDPLSGLTFNGATPINIYDASGGQHELTLYFVKSDTNAWQVHAKVDDTVTQDAASLTFDEVGKLAPARQTVTVNAAGASIEVDLSGSTQYGVPFSTNSAVQDGYAAGELTDVTVGEDGILQASYSNGQTRPAAQLVLATFANMAGLETIGNSQWAASRASGAEKLDTPGNMDPKGLGLGPLQGEAIEASNVDVGSALLSLIEQQRYYQANAQSVKAQDQLLQTLAGIR